VGETLRVKWALQLRWSSSLRILFVSAEAYPFAKTGGLGDVAGSLPKALAELGHEVNLIMPRYRGMDRWRVDLGPFDVPMGRGKEVAALKEGNLTHRVPVLMVDHLGYFDREAIYGYRDDGQRFALFCRAVLEACRYIDFSPDVIHCNDWHTALIPAYLRSFYSQERHLAGSKVLFTIHNLKHQGAFPRDLLGYVGLPSKAMERHLIHRGKVNFMKAGISLSDAISTVSETYAKEIQTPEFGMGLHRVLRKRRNVLFGVLNGIDPEVWNPERDEFLHQTYEAAGQRGKEANKRALQKELHLPRSRNLLVGFIARLVEQKGVDLLVDALPDILDRGIQVVILGTGRRRFEETLEAWDGRNRDLSINLRYDEGLAHRIYAGADVFLMPSRFEPCGLGQMIAMRYGTIPVVRRTGGLADTVADYSQGLDVATGFTFDDYTPRALVQAMDRALEVYEDTAAWRRMRRNCAAQEFSWARSARRYEDIYQRLAISSPGPPP
jgi:starch synthase